MTDEMSANGDQLDAARIEAASVLKVLIAHVGYLFRSQPNRLLNEVVSSALQSWDPPQHVVKWLPLAAEDLGLDFAPDAARQTAGHGVLQVERGRPSWLNHLREPIGWLVFAHLLADPKTREADRHRRAQISRATRRLVGPSRPPRATASPWSWAPGQRY